MPSELRIKCFLGDDATGGPGHAKACAIGPAQKSWNTTGDHAQVRDVLTALLDQLGSAAGDYLVKVVVHRKLEDVPSNAPGRCLNPGHDATLQRAPLRLVRHERSTRARVGDQPAACAGLRRTISA